MSPCSSARLLMLCLAIAPAAAHAADVAIRLDPALGSATVEEQQVRNVTGTCGGGIVRVLGMSDEYATSSFDYDAGRILVRSDGGEMVLGTDSVINDYNSITCMTDRKGRAMLVIAGQCAGSACGDAADYYVIDPVRRVFVAPKDPKAGTCDRACATRALGREAPEL